MEVNVVDEVNGRRITLMLSQEQYERAQIDSEYVQQLVAQHDADAIIVANHEAEPIAVSTEVPREQNTQGLFIWNDSCIFLLLSLYEEMKEDMNRKRHKTVFTEIASKMQEINREYRVNGSQCQSKINSLKKTYKKIFDHNATSGNDRATWPYFNRMREIFGSAGWANPEALASEAGSLPVSSDNDPVSDSSRRKRKIDTILTEFTQDLKKYREERAKTKQDNFNKLLEMKERQHREKMDILQRLCNNNV